jgi:hypothetical protein
MSYSKPLCFPAADNEREDVRHVAGVRARVQQLRAPPQEVTITDLSAGGCRLACTGLAEGDEVWITLAVLPPVRGRIAWVKAGEAGCEFHVPLRGNDFRKVLLNRFGSASEARPQKALYAPATDDIAKPAEPKLKILGVAPRR